jgi:hypothetical protein
MKRVQRIVVGVSLLFICGLLISAVVPSVPSGTWQATGDMAAPRTGATATLFPDGRLMIVGGTDASGEPLASAEFYNADGSVSAAPSMSVARASHAAIFLYDGRLLVTGGRVSGGGITNSAEVFDPLTNHWQTLSTTLLDARAGHTVSQLPDGSVLIAGGEDCSGPVSALEVFDLYNNFNAAGSLAAARKDHAAAVLPDGRVLIAGGTGYAADSSLVTLNTTEIYDPATNSVAAGPSMSAARAKHSATTLLDGRVLIAGGDNGSNDLASAEIYNPATGAISATDSMSAPRSGHTALLLPNNNAVLIAGGTSTGNDVATAELYESWNNAFKSTGSMTSVRTGAASSATSYDGLAMLAGGSNLPSTELYGFATVKTDKDDYSPGDVVTITGTGWEPQEAVTLHLIDSQGGSSQNLVATADGSGNIVNNSFIPGEADFGKKFYLTASGSNAKAQTSFTDATNVNAATIVTKESACTTNTSSFSRGQTVCASVEVTAVGGGGGAGDFFIVWFPPSGPSVRTTTKTVPASIPTTFTDTFTTTGSSALGTWKVSVCNNTGCTGGNQVAFANFSLAAADTTPPDTTITANPPNPSNSSSASFSFTGTDNITPSGSLTFECKLDGGSFAACTSPQNYTGLADGSHTFQVRAKDAANLVDATPASYTWMVDTGAPDTTITANPTALTNSTSAPFSFTADESPATFECKLDVGTFAACTSPQNYSGLAEGSHTFQVRAKDSANNVDGTPASYTWTIDTTAPTFSGARVTPSNANGWNNTDVTVEFTCTDANGIGSIDVTSGGTGTSTTSGLQVTVSAEGENQTVQASCTDAAGNSASASVADIHIDKTAPSATLSITAGTAGANGWYTSDVTVHTAGTDALSDIATCTADQSQTTESAGAVFNGSCTDKAGNVGNAAPLTVKLDKTGPSATLAVTAGTLGNNGWYKTDVTVSATGNDSISEPVTCTADQFLTVDTTGTAFNGSCTNDAGLSTTAAPLNVKLDKTAPTITFDSRTPANANGWNNSDVTVTWNCADATSESVSPTATQTISTEGENQSATGTCTDNAGNTSSDTQTGINIDKTAPSINASRTPAANANGWNNTDVTADYTASDDLSGLVDPATGSHTFNSEGAGQSHTFTVTDKAGNSASATISGVNIDKTAPLVTATPSPAANGNGWNNTNVTVTFDGTDGLSGLDDCDPAAELSSDGANQTATGSCTDKAGNSTSATATGINIDKTAPTITFVSRTPAPNSNGWNNSDVTVNWSCADGLSGAVAANVSQTVSTEAENQSSTGTCSDLAGNTASDTQTGINIDKTAPSISASRTPAANANGWNNTDVTANYTASDGLSGLVEPVTGSFTFTAESAGQSHIFTVTDNAGNSASATVDNVNIDKTAPTASATATPPPNGYGWNNTSVTVSFSGADGLSGIQSCASPVILATEGAGQSASGTCTDKAGNVSAAATASGISIDLTQPVVAVTGVTNGATYTLGAVPAAGCSTSDALSGVATSGSLSVSGGVPPGVGTFTASCNGAVDKAGNSKNTSVTYTVQYATGGMCLGSAGHQILEPINWNGTSVFKQKSTVPAKFRVCDANGNSIGTPGVVTMFKITQDVVGTVSSGVNEPVDSTTPFTEFRWDPTSMQWIFNISTKGLSANHTYGFLITLNDGTTIPFVFGLK